MKLHNAETVGVFACYLNRMLTHPCPELSFANDLADCALACSHATPQQQADGLPVGVQLALIAHPIQHLSQLCQCDQPEDDAQISTCFGPNCAPRAAIAQLLA